MHSECVGCVTPEPTLEPFAHHDVGAFGIGAVQVISVRPGVEMAEVGVEGLVLSMLRVHPVPVTSGAP